MSALGPSKGTFSLGVARGGIDVKSITDFRGRDVSNRIGAGGPGLRSDFDRVAFDFIDPVSEKVVEPNSNASPLSSLKIEVEKGVGRPWSDRARAIEIERSFALRWRGWFGGAQSCFPRAGGGGFHFKHDVAGIGHANADRAPIVRSADLFAHSHHFKNWLRALCLLVEEAGLFEAAVGGKAGGKSGDCGGEESRVLQVQLRIPFEKHWCVTKGAGNRGGKQASVVCENTAGRGSPSVAFADRGQARLQVAPKTSLLNLGRVGADCAARPVFWGAFYG